MKKIYLITLNGFHNFGNRLQNYALNTYLNNFGECKTIWYKKNRISLLLDLMKPRLFFLKKGRRYNHFLKFTNSYIKPIYTSNIKQFKDATFVVGSDQVWNITFEDFDNSYFLDFSKKNNNISYAASIGIDKIPTNKLELFVNGINNIQTISVREDRAKTIIKETTGREDVEVLIDPTMLLSAKEWELVSKKPKMLACKKYILLYFLGDLTIDKKNEISRIASENDCEIINLLDENSPFYLCGPSEFLYLEKNAFLICTDSFHSSVFAILFNRPFVVFDREQKDVKKMNSRIDTLLKKFELKNRKYNGKSITKENLENDYTKAYQILEIERKKSDIFLKKALNYKDSD